MVSYEIGEHGFICDECAAYVHLIYKHDEWHKKMDKSTGVDGHGD